MRYDLIIIGAGAAGLMAAAEAGKLGLKVLILESQGEAGLKLLITGGGRCNATHARVTEKDFHAGCRHTLRHVLKAFSSQDAFSFFQTWGAPLSLQPSGEFFSADDRARTVRDALLKAVSHYCVEIEYNSRVISIELDGTSFNVCGEGFRKMAKNILVN